MQLNDKIYIAGHHGLVGSAIWRSLTAKGYTNLIGKTRAELDLMDGVAVRDFFEIEKPDYVILAAAHVGGIMANNTYRADFIFNNLQIQQNIIGESYRQGVKKLLFLGSTCIYPREAPQPMQEDSLLTLPLEYTNEPYAIAKIAGLKLCESFNIQYNTNFIAVMPTNLYGPNDNFDLEKSHVLPAIIRKMHLAKNLLEGDFASIRNDFDANPIEGVNGSASEKEILTVLSRYGISKKGTQTQVEIWGTGRPMREFLWSEDMAEACVYLMEHIDFDEIKRISIPEGEKEIRNCHINIGTGKDISIADLAMLIKEKVGYAGEVIFNSDKPDGALKKLTDPSKLHKLGWKHKVEIDEGVERLYKWYLEANNSKL